MEMVRRKFLAADVWQAEMWMKTASCFIHGHTRLRVETTPRRYPTIHEVIARSCIQCDAPPEKHANGKCLWEPTAYAPLGSPAAKKLIERWRRSGDAPR